MTDLYGMDMVVSKEVERISDIIENMRYSDRIFSVQYLRSLHQMEEEIVSGDAGFVQKAWEKVSVSPSIEQLNKEIRAEIKWVYYSFCQINELPENLTISEMLGHFETFTGLA